MRTVVHRLMKSHFVRRRNHCPYPANMGPRGNLTYRLRIPVALSRRRRRRTGLRGGSAYLLGRRRRRAGARLRGGFLPFLAPIIAAAIGAIPGIASVAVQAAHNK